MIYFPVELDDNKKKMEAFLAAVCFTLSRSACQKNNNTIELSHTQRPSTQNMTKTTVQRL